LTRLHPDESRARDAPADPVYRRFTEGLKTADLLNAKALHDTLRL
jgi:hypothetical protein